MGFYKSHSPKGNNVNSPTFQRGDSVGRSQRTDPEGVAQTVDVRAYFRLPALHPLQDGILRREEAHRRSAVSRLKSGVRIIRAIYITVLKRGDSEEHAPQNMRIIVRSETASLRDAAECA